MTVACFLASAINPNGFRVIEIMLLYRSSGIQSSNLEWQYPAFWLPPYGYGLVLFGSLLAMLISWRRTRPVDWILYFVFARGLAAGRAQHDSDGPGRRGAARRVSPGLEARDPGGCGIRGGGDCWRSRSCARCARRRISIARRGVACCPCRRRTF